MKILTFRILRQISGKTASEVAEKLGIAEESYKTYEYSARLPKTETLFKMQGIFDCTLEEIRQAYIYHAEEQKRKKGRKHKKKRNLN